MCGVVGVWGIPDAGARVRAGLIALQHRGQESAGLAWLDRGRVRVRRWLGLVRDGGPIPPTTAAIGHVRYSTLGHQGLAGAQPYPSGAGALVHNGQLFNHDKLSTGQPSDSAALAFFLRDTSSIDFLARLLRRVQGAYSLIYLSPSGMLAARDPNGYRPLAYGRIGSGFCVASETTAIEVVGGTLVGEVEAGTVIGFDTSSRRWLQRKIGASLFAPCSFEHIYFARPDSVFAGAPVYRLRFALGYMLGSSAPVEADVVTGVPESGLIHAQGYAQATGIEFRDLYFRNRFANRTFIEPAVRREEGVRNKYSVYSEWVKGQRVVLVDDSIVRGTTIGPLVALLTEAGAREVHVRVASPPLRYPCRMGVDIPTREELVANRLDPDELAASIGADSLEYLTVASLYDALRLESGCYACFTGVYP